MGLGHGHEVDGAASVQRAHQSVLDALVPPQRCGGGARLLLRGDGELVGLVGAVGVLFASEDGALAVEGRVVSSSAEVDDEEGGDEAEDDDGGGYADADAGFGARGGCALVEMRGREGVGRGRVDGEDCAETGYPPGRSGGHHGGVKGGVVGLSFVQRGTNR